MYHLRVLGCLALASLISSHVVPSLLFFLLLSLLKACYKFVAATNQPTLKTTLDFSGQKEKVYLAMDAFEKLNELVKRLGNIYGRYLIVEMCAFFTTLITNLFALLSGFQEGSVEWQTVGISMIINILWFYVLSESGEEMMKQVRII
jgi:hypothetical protein